MITQEHKDKLNLLRLDYSTRKDNSYVGSGLGGNILYLGYISEKEVVVDNACHDISISDKIYFNPAFLDLNIAKIRAVLDPMIADAIEKENYKFVVNDDGTANNDLIDDRLKSLDANLILIGEKELPDLPSFNYGNQLCICVQVCNAFANHLDNDPNVKELYDRFLSLITKFDDAIALFGIRSQITIERLVKHNLDKVDGLCEYFKGLNKKLQ